MVECVRRLVAKQLHAPLALAPLHLQHDAALEAREARVRQEERDGEAGGALRREPVRGEPDVGPEAQPGASELGVQASDARLERRALDAQAQVAEPDVEELFGGQPRPPVAPRPSAARVLAASVSLRPHAPRQDTDPQVTGFGRSRVVDGERVCIPLAVRELRSSIQSSVWYSTTTTSDRSLASSSCITASFSGSSTSSSSAVRTETTFSGPVL